MSKNSIIDNDIPELLIYCYDDAFAGKLAALATAQHIQTKSVPVSLFAVLARV